MTLCYRGEGWEVSGPEESAPGGPAGPPQHGPGPRLPCGLQQRHPRPRTAGRLHHLSLLPHRPAPRYTEVPQIRRYDERFMMYFSLSLDTQKFLNVCIVNQRFICNQVNFAKSVIVNISH